MSKAIKCDKCGTCMCPDDTDEELVSFETVTVTDGTTRKKHCIKRCKTFVELCPECSKQFLEFMKMEEKK